MVTIIPAILATSEEDYKTDIENVSGTPSLEGGWVHVDFMDNLFVHNKSIEPEIVSKYPTELKKEAHLMVMQPLNWLDKLLEAEFDRVIVHVEAEEVLKCIEYLKGRGVEVGLAVKHETDLGRTRDYLGLIDVLLIMSIDAGFQGQPFLPDSINRIQEALRIRTANSSRFLVAVDGSVSSENVGKLVKAGVDNLSVGSHLVKGDVEENLEKLWEAVHEESESVVRLIHVNK